MEAERLLAPEFDSAAALLAAAFFDNPAHVYMFPDEHRRRRRLGWVHPVAVGLN